jgi:hypothetical protein
MISYIRLLLRNAFSFIWKLAIDLQMLVFANPKARPKPDPGAYILFFNLI